MHGYCYTRYLYNMHVDVGTSVSTNSADSDRRLFLRSISYGQCWLWKEIQDKISNQVKYNLVAIQEKSTYLNCYS